MGPYGCYSVYRVTVNGHFLKVWRLVTSTDWLIISLQVHSEYSVLFEDPSYPDGYSPPLDVPQRYVLPVRETKRK